MAIGREQSIGNHKTSSGNACPQLRRMAFETHLIHAENITDGVAVAIQDQGRHGLLLLQLLNFVFQRLHFLFEFMRSAARVIMRNQTKRDQQKHP
jgi:hypothetical protein